MILSRAQLHRLRQIARGRSDEELALLEGPKAIHDALERGHVAEVWIRDGETGPLVEPIRALAASRQVPIGSGDAKAFERLGATVTPQGVFALVSSAARPLDELAAGPGFLLWLDGVQDPGNVGAVIRIAAAFGVAGVLVGSGTADPMGTKALRASAGLALSIPFARAPSHVVAAALHARPVWTLEAGGRDVMAIDDVPDDLVLVLGSEGRGPGEDASGVASERVGIPIDAVVESLNVAVAAGIAVAALTRGARS